MTCDSQSADTSKSHIKPDALSVGSLSKGQPSPHSYVIGARRLALSMRTNWADDESLNAAINATDRGLSPSAVPCGLTA